MFKKIKNTDFYEVNELGVVRSLDKIVYQFNGIKMINRTIKGTILKFKSIRGYSNVNIYYDKGLKKTRQVHRLVLETFRPIKNMENLQVNHINGIKNDNRLENLEWMTPKENTNHAYRNGLAKYKKQNGELNCMAKLNCKNVIEIKKLLDTLSDSEIGKLFKVSRRTINLIRNNKTWKNIIL